MHQRRFSRESQQEQISRRQIAERFLEFGWIPSEPSLDLGEDFWVHIYIEGRATGVTFHVQAKSTSDLARFRKSDLLCYSLKTKDLKHWELFSTPVVLIIWDTAQREGRWELTSRITKELDENRPQWRNNSSRVRVRIPWVNTLADKDLLRLKALIGRHFYPQISEGKGLEGNFVFSFSNSPEGDKAHQDFQRFLKRGEPVTLKGDTIQGIHFSEWWEQWFGEFWFERDGVELELGAATSPSVPAVIHIIGNNGESASIPYIEFRLVQAGSEYIRLTNEHQMTPLRFILGIGRQTPELSVASRGFGNDLEETLNVLRFLDAIASGGKLRVIFRGLEDKPLLTSVTPQPSAAPDSSIVDIVNKLVKIQNKTGVFIKIPLQGISAGDMKSINDLSAILASGSTTEIIPSASLEMESEALGLMLNVHRQGHPISLRITYEGSSVELFGIKISTGPMTRMITGFIELPVAALEKAIAELTVGQILSVKLVRVTVTETFAAYGR